MKTYLPLSFLLVVGCTEAGDVPSREAPECKPFTSSTAVSFGTDYFSVCGRKQALGDSAYNFVADADGMYRFILYPDGVQWVNLELRKGSCVTTPAESGAEALESEPLCGSLINDEIDQHMEASVYLLKDEVVTVIAEGEDGYNSPQLVVTRACLGARTRDGELLPEISGAVPLEEEFQVPVGSGSLRDVSCGGNVSGMHQMAVTWRAPEDGSYRIGVEETTDESRAITLAALEENCGGEVVECSYSESEAGDELFTEIELTATTDQILSLLVALEGGYEGYEVRLQVEKL